MGNGGCYKYFVDIQLGMIKEMVERGGGVTREVKAHLMEIEQGGERGGSEKKGRGGRMEGDLKKGEVRSESEEAGFRRIGGRVSNLI